MTKRKNKRMLSAALLIGIAVCLLAGKLFSLSRYTAFVIASASMCPEYPVNTIIIVKSVDIDSLKIGDVVVYKSDAMKGQKVFHRITRFCDGGFYTKGDANNHEDNQLVTRQALKGKAVCKITVFANYLSTISTLKGFLLFAATPIVLLLVTVKSVKYISKVKKL